MKILGMADMKKNYSRKDLSCLLPSTSMTSDVDSLVVEYQYWLYKIDGMNSILTHTVAHSTMSWFGPKTNNQPLKKFLCFAVSWVKVVKNCKILTFKVNFLCQKLSESFQKKFSLNNINLGAHILLLTFFDNFTF